MDDQISWQVELLVKDGQLERFRALTGEMVASTRREEGVLSYQRFVTGDGRFVYVYERYVNSAAALAHLKTFRLDYGDRFSSMVDRRRFTVFGQPTDELRKILDGFGATYLTPFGAFPYWAKNL